MSEKLLTVSVVFGKNDNLILPCLRSLYEMTDMPFDLYVTCNWQSEKTVEKIKNEFPDAKIIVNANPLGFAKNHNNIIRILKTKYILILNDDVLILKNAIDKLVEYMEENKDIGAISPKLLNADGSLQQSTYGFPTIFKDSMNLSGLRSLIPFNDASYKLAFLIYGEEGSRFWKHDKIAEVDTFRGACVLVRKETIDQVGIMDEVCLAYGEETEWHFRMKKMKWKIIFYPPSEIIHYGGATSKKIGYAINFEQIKGMLNFYHKHKTTYEYIFLRLVISFVYTLKLIGSILSRNNNIATNYNIIKTALNPKKYLYER